MATYDYLLSPTGTTSTVSNFLPSTNTSSTTLSSANLSSSSTPSLPPKPIDNTNYTGYTTGGNTMIAANTVYTTPSGAQVDGSGNIVGSTPTEATPQTSALDTFKSYLSNLVAPPSASDTYNKDYATSGIDQKQTDFNAKQQILLNAQSKFNGLNAQLQGLDAEAKAIPIQDQQDATGRGITAAGLAPKTADELRTNALKAIPIQTQALVAQAEVAAAQGNAQLSQSILQQAQDHLDKVFQIHLTDATNKYNYQNNIIDKIYTFATKQEQDRLDELKTQKANDFTQKQNLLSHASTLANTAISSGQGALAGKILALNPDSPTYQQDLAKLSSQIVPKATGGVGDVSDPTVQAWVSAVLNGNATMQQVPTAYRNATALALANQPGTSYSPLAASRFTTAANKIVANYVDLPAYKLVAGGQIYLGRIAAAMQTPGSVSDQDLLDSLTKLNTGGNAISDAQVKLITDGKSFSDAVSVFQNKFSSGGVLSAAQRTQIQTLAQAIFSNYQKQYQPIYDQVTSQLKSTGIPQAFWTIPDLNTLTAQANQAIGGTTGTTTSKGTLTDSQFVEKAVTASGQSYNSIISGAPKGQIAVVENSSGQIGYIPAEEFNSSYTRL